MRKSIFALFTAMFVLISGAVAGNVLAKPADPAPLEFSVDVRFSTVPGETGTLYPSTVAVDRFVEQDGLLAVQGVLTGPAGAPFEPFAVTLVAVARASEDTESGCTVAVDTAADFVDTGYLVFVNGGTFALKETEEPDAARELCRVVRTATRDSADQSALARALNQVLRAA
jgi:hypothetical protein